MDMVEINYNDEVLNGQEMCSVVVSSDHILSPDLPGVDYIHEDESVAPRIGDMYQVEIPPLMTESEWLHLIHTRTEMDKFLGVNLSVVPGSATPIVLSESVDNHLEREQEKIPGIDGCSMPLSVANADYKESLTAPDNDEGIGILPGIQATPWTAAESKSFLLGLYIFGKNLALIRRFVGTKDMGDVLCFYYGKFYRSDAHRRWSECRKMRSRRCIHGSRIFTGWRQQELLSRLLPGISKDLQDALLEAVKVFNEGNASFEEFVFQLKALIGTEVLVEAVGIGKGKHDLTGIVLDPMRANQVLSVRSDIPIGKACSSLATGEIIKFLTGNFRLSKARSNDLFWEAVWPRLLARGWHSEQPKDLGSFGSRNALVFLIPGIKKFSRRKLVKGNHYFDSITDILNKVALDPKLLELEVEGSVSAKEENGWVADTQPKRNNSSSENQRRCYLRPRVSNCSPEDMKFTVVDTSWDHGDAPKKVRELRSLPADAQCGLSPSKCSEETYTESGSSSDEHIHVNISLVDRKECNLDISVNETRNEKITSFNGTFRADVSDVSDQLSASSKQEMPLSEHGSNNHSPGLLNEKQPCKDTKNQSSWQHNYLAPVVKRRRLNACKNTGNKRPCAFPGSYPKEEISYRSKPLEAKENTFVGSSCFSFPRADQLKKEESSCTLKLPKRSEATSAGTNSPETKKLCLSLADDGDRNDKCVFSDIKTSLHDEKPRAHNMIDLNVPYLSLELKSDHDSNKEKIAFQSEPEQHLKSSQSSEISDSFVTQPESATNGRRHSTRNRPLTTKALEAFACGFLSTKRRVRGTKNLPSRSSGRAPTSNREPSAPFPVDYGFIRPNALVSNIGISDEYRLYANHAKGKEAHDLLGMP